VLFAARFATVYRTHSCGAEVAREGLFSKMSEPPTGIANSWSASGYEDGLGRRSLEIDRESGAMLEQLHLRPELGAFESFLRERVAFTVSFDDDRFARVKGIERDPRGSLTIISQFVAGTRLAELLEAATGLPADEATCPSVDAALGFLLEILPSLGSLHEHGGHAHGTLAPERIVLTPASQVVVLDWLYGPTIQRLQFNKRRLWSEFGVATPSAPGPLRLDIPGDISQASLAAMMIVLGRPLRENEYPDALGPLVSEVIEIAQIRGSSHFGAALQAFLERTLPLPSRTPHANAAEAAAEVRHIAREIGVSRCRTALTAFVDDMNRMLAEERAQAERAAHDAELVGIDAAVDELAAAMIPDLSSGHQDFGLADPSIGIDLLPEPSVPAFDEFDASVGTDVFEDPPIAIAESVPPERPLFEAAPPVAPDAPDAPVEIEHAPVRFEPVVEPQIDPEPLRPAEAEPIPEPIVEAHSVAIAAPVTVVSPSFPAPPFAPEPIAAAPSALVTPQVAAAPAPVPETAAPAPMATVPMAVAAPTATPSPAPPSPPSPSLPAPAPPQATNEQSKRNKRGSKRRRDKLRSNAAPPAPKPAALPPPPPPPAPLAIPMPTFNPLPDPFRQNAPTPPPAPIAMQPPAPKPATPLRLKSDAPADAPVRLKTDSPATFTPPPPRIDRRDAPVFRMPSFERDDAHAPGKFPWHLAAAAVVGIIALIGVGRYYLASHKEPTETVDTAAVKETAAPEKLDAAKPGTVAITTQPAGAHVFLDGKPVGDSPVTLQGVASGKHTLTFVTSSGTVKKPIRVEPGKPLSVDVPIYSGWIAVFSPVTLDIAENGKAIGTTEQGRLMLSPGRHTLTFSNQDMGYKTTQAVDIEPGEERSVSLVPTGELNANATPWAEVWMNGKKVGETPVAALRVPLGTHEVIFKNPTFSDRQVTVTVRATAPAIAFVDFTK
jgi:PEGA domain-containing protein